MALSLFTEQTDADLDLWDVYLTDGTWTAVWADALERDYAQAIVQDGLNPFYEDEAEEFLNEHGVK